ncbi:MAG: type II toxin-antitoxin system VapC family toxin [Candidatus Acidiferrales bacterium]
MRILLDTSVLIDVLRKRNKRRELLASLVDAHHTLVTTVLNIAELYAGMRPAERAMTERLLEGLLCLGITERAARRGGALKNIWSRRGRTLGLTDALIAAVAIEEECALLTDNQKDFPMPELHLYPRA